MTVVLVALLARGLAFIVLYLIIGFGPGFILGMLLANLFAAGAPRYMDMHEEAKKRAVQHNAQWDPSHERWQKE